MLSEKQWEIMCFGSTDYDAIICDGAIRSGKTSVMSVAYIEWAMDNFDHCAFIVAGVSVETAKRNVINPAMATGYLMKKYSMRWTGSANCLTVTGGGKSNVFYVFGGKDEASYRTVQGLTAAGCMLDEVTLMPQSFVEQCLARCSVEGSKFWFSCNPTTPAHWFYREWVLRSSEQNAYRLHFALTDNPSLGKKIIDRYHRMYTGVFYQRYVEGAWVAAEGLVYPNWEKCIEDKFEPEKDEDGKLLVRQYCVSCDYGTQNAFFAIKWVREGKTWHAIDEYRYSGRDEGIQKTDQDYVEDMLAFVADCPTEEPLFIVDPSAASFIAALRKAGAKVRKAKNDIDDGLRDTAVSMQAGYIKLADSLEELKKELSAYVWDEDKDKPIKENDHGADAMRYFVETMRVYNPKQEYRSPFERALRHAS